MGPGSEARSISEKQHDLGGFCVFSISRLAKRIYSCAGGTVNDWIAFRTIECRGIDRPIPKSQALSSWRGSRFDILSS